MTVTKSIILKSIGKVQSTRTQVEDDNWEAESASIELDSRLSFLWTPHRAPHHRAARLVQTGPSAGHKNPAKISMGLRLRRSGNWHWPNRSPTDVQRERAFTNDKHALPERVHVIQLPAYSPELTFSKTASATGFSTLWSGKPSALNFKPFTIVPTAVMTDQRSQ